MFVKLLMIFNSYKLSGIFRLLFALIRGLPMSIISQRLIFLGKGARISNISNMRGKGIIKLEEYSHLQCDSKDCYVGSNFSLGAFSNVRPSSEYLVSTSERLIIGDNTTFGPYCYIGGKSICIGDDNKFGMGIRILAENHVVENGLVSGKDTFGVGITIGSGNWIGANVVFLDGSTIGNNNSIGACTLITKKDRILNNSTWVSKYENRCI